MKKKILVNIIFWACLLGAVGCFLYPQYTKLKAASEKKELINTIKATMKENAANKAKEEREEAQAAAAAERPHVTLDPVEGTIEEHEEEPGLTPEQIAAARKKAIEDNLAKQQVLGIIDIPSVNILEPVVEGTTKDNLKCAAGHVEGTNNIGEEGNCVICAHNGGLYGVLFKYLKNVKLGDTVTITDEFGEEYNYEVYDSFTVEPDEVWILEDLKEDDGTRLETLTLFTCENNGKIRRVIRCDRV